MAIEHHISPTEQANLAWSAVVEARGICKLIQFSVEQQPHMYEAAGGACRLLEIAAERIESAAKFLPGTAEVSNG